MLQHGTIRDSYVNDSTPVEIFKIARAHILDQLNVLVMKNRKNMRSLVGRIIMSILNSLKYR